MSLSDMTPERVEELLLAFYVKGEDADAEGLEGEELDDFIAEYRSNMWGELSWMLRQPKEVEGLGIVECVYDFGGEGKGDHLSVVFKISIVGEEKYFEKTGYYASYEGSNWEEGWWGEVEPYEELVVKYRSKSGKKW